MFKEAVVWIDQISYYFLQIVLAEPGGEMKRFSVLTGRGTR